MRAVRALGSGLTLLLSLGPAVAPADPFYSAGVSGVADANESSRPCDLPGEVSEGYQTFPLDAFETFAEGEATAFNPCSALSGSALSHSSAHLATGQLRVFALAQIGQNMFTQEARAYAYFSDDVTILFAGTPLATLPGGLVGEIRLDVHGTRSAQLLDASASLEVSAPNGAEIGVVDVDDLHDGASLVVPFSTPFSFFASLSVTAADGEFADFGNTATVAVTLPDGYEFGSSSGVLLTPEVAGGAPSVAAFCAIALLRWSRR